jgi:protein kinase C substrate 80K-H
VIRFSNVTLHCVVVTRTVVMFEPSASQESRLNELEWEKQDLEMQADSLRHDMSKESFFGPESIYIVFRDKCFNYDSGSSSQYSICWFKDASLSSPGNYQRLGNWKGWYEHSNGSFDYHKAQFVDGYRCGADSREATVDLICGMHNQIVSVSEPEPCKHLFKFTTPAACLY